jgi:hypothetical protein
MMPNQDYREHGEESPNAKCSKGSLWSQQCVGGHYHATALFPMTAILVSVANSLLKSG